MNGFEKMKAKDVDGRAKERRALLKDFFAGNPRYVTELALREFLADRGWPDLNPLSARNDLKHFGYAMTNKCYGTRDSMAVSVRNRSGFLVQSWVYVNTKMGYSDKSYDEFMSTANPPSKVKIEWLQEKL